MPKEKKNDKIAIAKNNSEKEQLPEKRKEKERKKEEQLPKIRKTNMKTKLEQKKKEMCF